MAKKDTPSNAGGRKAKFPQYFASTAAKKLRNIARRNGPDALAAYKDQLIAKARKA